MPEPLAPIVGTKMRVATIVLVIIAGVAWTPYQAFAGDCHRLPSLSQAIAREAAFIFAGRVSR
jgi:hypothetical protein